MRKVIKNREENKKSFIFKGIQVSIKDPLPQGINVMDILKRAEYVIPDSYFGYVDAIYFGDFDILSQKDFSAVYDQGAVFMSSKQVSVADATSHLVHEFAHAVEQNNSSLLYTDGNIEREFVAKREKVHSLLASEGFEIPLSLFYNVEYDDRLDDILYNDVGYPMLAMLTTNIFLLYLRFGMNVVGKVTSRITSFVVIGTYFGPQINVFLYTC